MAASGKYLQLLDELKDLHIRKNAGYAGFSIDPWANFRACEKFGISATDGVITRMSDKWSRLQSLRASAKNEQVGESIEDTLMDLSAYGLILICLLREGPPIIYRRITRKSRRKARRERKRRAH